MFKSRYNLAYWAQCLSSIERCQAWEERGNVRRYLADLVRRGWFEIICPETGRPLRSGASVIIADKTTVFSFPDRPSLLVAVGDMSMGYPICAVLMTDRHVWVDVTASHWGFAERHLAAFVAIVAATGWTPGPATLPLRLVLGDPNYAHHAWNQLSGLEDLLRVERAGAVELVATGLPLGPLHALLPEVSSWPLVRTPEYHLEALNAPGGLFVPVGGHFIRNSLIARIFTVAQAHVSAPCQAIRVALDTVPGPVLWMSVRKRNRTAINLDDMLVALGTRFLEGAPDGAVVIDGHSVAADLDTIHPDISRDILNMAERDLKAAEAIRAAIVAAVGPQAAARVHVAVGLTITDSILLSRQAHFYFCHHGTVQHKVGWFNAVPGVVHSNEHVAGEAPAEGIAQHSEAAIPPLYLPPQHVRDTREGDAEMSEFSHLLNHDNYIFLDIPRIVDVVLAHARAAGVNVAAT